MAIICLLIVLFSFNADAEKNTIEKLKARDWDVWLGDGGYDLAMMGENAAAFLVNVLSNEDEQARWHANYLLSKYYAEPSILPALEKLFLQNTDKSIKSNAIHLIASVDAEYAKKLISSYLDVKDMQDIVVSTLSILKDERAVPFLLERLKIPELRVHSAYALADLKEKRAVPILLEVVKDPKTREWERNNALEKLAHIADERTVTLFLDFFEKQESISYMIKLILSDSQSSFIFSLLESIEEMNIEKSAYKWNAVLDILGNQKDPDLISHYEKILLETQDISLKNKLTYALSNMGEKGLKSLTKLLQRQPNPIVLRNLASYYSKTSFNAIASIAIDKSSPIRMEAIQALLQYSSMWNEEVSEHIRKLLPDVNAKGKLVILEALPKLGGNWNSELYKYLRILLADQKPGVRILTIELIRRMNLTVMIPELEKLMQDVEESILEAAHMVYDILNDIPQLTLEIEMDQDEYEFMEPITLTYRIKNVSDHNINIALYKSLVSTYLKLTIRRPDGTIAKYRGPIASLIPLGFRDIKSLKPGDEITGKIKPKGNYNLYQEGVYTIELEIRPGLRGVVSENYFSGRRSSYELIEQPGLSKLTWSDTLTSQNEFFKIKPIPAETLKVMIGDIKPNAIRKENEEGIKETCNLLALLRNPSGIAALKKLALMETNSKSSEDFRYEIKRYASDMLLNFPDPELVPTWIEMLGYGNLSNVRYATLGESGNTLAIESLRRITFGLNNTNRSISAAKALLQLGDVTGVEWLRKIAYRKLRHWNEDERQNGASILYLLDQPKSRYSTRWHSLKSLQFYAAHYYLYLDWEDIREKSTTLDGLKELLKHESPIIQKSAAYELGYQGDSSGIHLIRKDLHANESSIRLHARETISSLRSK